jgi:ABC-type polysaccharide/polyol phosphate transport system ATPase subunit
MSVTSLPETPTPDSSPQPEGRESDDRPPIVEVTRVSKRFIVERSRAADLRERFAGLRGDKGPSEDEFWALKDISFTVRPGESVGIVGHNGSGKSTLLKMLTGIIKPTQGEVHIRGRVGALIEVGAGFHPDLSGRENIFLNGSILGLSRKEIAARFDAIVAFAGLEQFIDTPVKRYSSGMYMRLGFSVAAHTHPDILLIDEVLAVGDTQFQNRCLHFLKEYTRKGGTVVFVSHAMDQVVQVCDRCLWLDYGEIRFVGPARDAIDQYMQVVREREEAEFQRIFPEEWAEREAERSRQEEEARQEEALRAVREQERIREADARFQDPWRGRLTGVTLRDRAGNPRTDFEAGEALTVEIGYRFRKPLPNPAFCFEVFRDDGLHMFTTSNYDHRLEMKQLPLAGRVTFHIPFLSLNEGTYTVRLRLYSDWRLGAWDTVMADEIRDAATMTVTAGRFAHGCAYIPVAWSESAVENQSDTTAMTTREVASV